MNGTARRYVEGCFYEQPELRTWKVVEPTFDIVLQLECGVKEGGGAKEIVSVTRARPGKLRSLRRAKEVITAFAPVRCNRKGRKVNKPPKKKNKRDYNLYWSFMSTVGWHYHNGKWKLSKNSAPKGKQQKLSQEANAMYTTMQRVSHGCFANERCKVTEDSKRSFHPAGSSGLSNEAHIDPYDSSLSLAMWLNENEPEGGVHCWYFLLPEYKVKIKLSHGVIINWDGRTLRHCSISQDEEGYNVPDCTALFIGTKFSYTSQFNTLTNLRKLLINDIGTNEEWRRGCRGFERRDLNLFEGDNEREKELKSTPFIFLKYSDADKGKFIAEYAKVKIKAVKKVKPWKTKSRRPNEDREYTLTFEGSPGSTTKIRSSRYLIKQQTFNKYMEKNGLLTTENRHIISSQSK